MESLPENWLGQDLWHVDQIIRNHLLTSWAVEDFPFFTVWVPTFADAILELWPCAVEPQLRHWLSNPDSMIFAILLETWGWNLVAFQLTQKQLTTLFFDADRRASDFASRLANRVQWTSGRPFYAERFHCGNPAASEVGSMARVFELLEGMLGVPPCVASALRESRLLLHSGIPNLQTTDLVSPTLPFTL